MHFTIDIILWPLTFPSGYTLHIKSWGLKFQDILCHDQGGPRSFVDEDMSGFARTPSNSISGNFVSWPKNTTCLSCTDKTLFFYCCNTFFYPIFPQHHQHANGTLCFNSDFSYRPQPVLSAVWWEVKWEGLVESSGRI